jgi:hypothetical protein
LIDAIITLSPKIIEALFVLLSKLQETMLKYVPKMVDTGMKLLIGVLNGIANNIGGVVTAATNVVVAFINAMAKNQPRVIQAGVDFIISFINGLAAAIRNNSKAMGDAGANLGSAIVEGIARGIAGGVGRIVTEAKNAAKKALDAAKNFLGIHSPSKEFEKLGAFSAEGLANGIDKMSKLVRISTEDMAKLALSSLSSSLSNMAKLMTDKVDIQPVIRPILDLTDLQSNAGQINRVLSGARMINLQASTSNAQQASIGFQTSKSTVDEIDPTDQPPAMVQYNQYNTSPKALSSAEIYRQTKNQLSKSREVVSP